MGATPYCPLLKQLSSLALCIFETRYQAGYVCIYFKKQVNL
jgi:hypothetical protein